nr:aspartate-semialdehyde dehydrogenase [Vibrio anguillarum]
DSFHTGYNLEALTLLADSLSTGEFKSSIELGFKFYKTQFFEADGTAKYYHNNRYPLDMHSVSQAVLTLLKVGGTADDLIMADRIISNAIEILYLKNKRRFVYQKNQYYTNKIDYIRWTKAWVYYSFSYYQRYIFLNKN